MQLNKAFRTRKKSSSLVVRTLYRTLAADTQLPNVNITFYFSRMLNLKNYEIKWRDDTKNVKNVVVWI